MNLPEKNHNNPPEMIDLARDVTRQVSAWFAENPAVTSEKEAKDIKLQIDRAKLCMRDLEDERDSKVRPLNDRVAAINFQHKAARKPLDIILGEMLGALDVYIKAEEDRRLATAREAERKAHEAEKAAREAEKLERDRMENLRLGEVGLDLASVIEDADAAFAEYEKAQREAIRLQEATRVKVAGGFTRAISIREKEVLTITDPVAFMQDIVSICATGTLPQALVAAMLTAARTIRRTHNRLPKGITSTIERHSG